MIPPVIQVRNLTKRFDEITAVDGISFEAAPGAIIGLLGGNGAGKTTTISMLLGLLLPSDGEVRVLGTDMARDRYRVLSRINFSSPYVELPKRLSVAENLAVYAGLYGVPGRGRRISELAEDLAITDLLRRPFGQLSSGQRTRVTIAKALLNRPEVLLLDEPTASLDPDAADWVRAYLSRYRAETGAAILLTSHNMPEVERMCDDVLIMKSGRIVDRGAPGVLIRRYGRQTMEDVFLDIARERMPDGAAGQSAGAT